MPRKDSITGCMVMTQGEFWAHEAKHEGKGRTPGELMHEFYDELEADRKRVEKSYYEPSVALGHLKDFADMINETSAPEDQVPVPTKVLQVTSAHHDEGFGGSSSMIMAEVEGRFPNGKVVRGWMRLEQWSTRGSMMEPPDGDFDIFFVADCSAIRFLRLEKKRKGGR